MPDSGATRRDRAAENIIRCEGLTFALAASGGTEGDLREARTMLKAAIVAAMRAEFEIGHRDAGGA